MELNVLVPCISLLFWLRMLKRAFLLSAYMDMMCRISMITAFLKMLQKRYFVLHVQPRPLL